MSHLTLCDGCSRHVRSDDESCPFCEQPLSARPVPAQPAGRLGRAALFAFGTAVAATVTLTGCGDSHAPADGGAAVDAGVEVDAGSSGSDAGFDAGAVVPPYGAPPEDAGGPMPLYGGAPSD